jgi:MOSC domain-containing protein YiiM
MATDGRVDAVFVAPASEEPVERRESVEAVAGRGLRGDRYFGDGGTFEGDHCTLIEREALAAAEREYGVELDPGAHRRNVVTHGVALNHLVGIEFRVGDARLRGERLCEPCTHLESLTEDGVLDALVHRGGLRASLLDGGTVAVDDPVVREP